MLEQILCSSDVYAMYMVLSHPVALPQVKGTPQDWTLDRRKHSQYKARCQGTHLHGRR